MASIYVIAALLLVIYFLVKLTHRKNLPPGPPPIPILGNALQFIFGQLQGKSNADVMLEWKRKYGNVYTMWLGPLPVVTVVDYKTAVDAFVKNGEAHAGRPETFVFQKPRQHMGVVFTDGPEWQEHRRFALHTLRNFGLGRNIMQQKILEEAFYRFDALDKQLEDSKSGFVDVNPTPFLEVLISSIINKLIAGYRYDETNIDEFRSLKRNIDKMMDALTPLDQITLNEYTYKLPFLRKRYATLVQPQHDVHALMTRQIKDRQVQVASGHHHLDMEHGGDDYIDAFLIEIEKRKQAGEEIGSFDESHLAANLLDLWVAGSETTITSISWCFAYLIHYTEIQEKLREEIFKVTCGNRPVEFNDKPHMPYTNAVVTETLRCGNVLNFNLLHMTRNKTVVGDYMIPQGVCVTVQMSVTMNDEKDFVNPTQFNPERYIENKCLEKQVIPFGIGKRSCLGESLARLEMFLIITNFVQKYKITAPNREGLPNLNQLSLGSLMKRIRPFNMSVEKV